MKVIPLQKWVLLEVKEYNELKHGLVIPDRLKKKIPRGQVVSYGKYCDNTYITGETVLYSKSGSKALPNDLVLVHEHRIELKEI